MTSNFSFSHSVFKRLVSQGRQKASLCGNGLNKEGNVSNLSVRHAKNSHFCSKKSVSFTENQ